MQTPFSDYPGDSLPKPDRKLWQRLRPFTAKLINSVSEFWNAPGKFRWPLFLIALLGALASVFFLRSSLDLDQTVSIDHKPKGREVIVAKQSLSPGDVLTRENLAISKVPDDFFDDSMFVPDRFPDIDGLVMTQTLAPGQALSTAHIRRSERRHPSLGLRRIQLVLADRYGFKQLPLPGDFVDFYWQMTQAHQPSTTHPDNGSYIVEDVQLVSIKRSSELDAQSSTRRPDKGSWIHIEVEVIPEAALRLLKASAHGALQMVLRNPDDRSLGQALSNSTLKKNVAIIDRAAASPSQRPNVEKIQDRATQAELAKSREQGLGSRVEVIRGGQRTLEQIHSSVEPSPAVSLDPARVSPNKGIEQDRSLSSKETQEMLQHLRRLTEPSSTQAGVIEK
jgi:Flp pilus assembly protein CpaB